MIKSRYLIPFILAGVLLASCKKEDPPEVNNTPYFVEFYVNGEVVRYEDGENEYGNSLGRKIETEAGLKAYSEYTFYSRDQTDPDYLNSSIGIEMITIYDHEPEYTEIFGSWTSGDRDYGMWEGDSIPLMEPGVMLTYRDSTGKIWSSGTLFGPQNGSTFEITSHRAVNDNQYKAESEGAFNCLLHDGSGNVLTITQGTFKARTIRFL